MDNCSTIMAISLENREETSREVQGILTKYGCSIRARMGLREGAPDRCTNMGLIILQLCGNGDVAEKMQIELNEVKSVKAKYMKLDF